MTTDTAGLAHALRPLVFRLYYVVRRHTPQHQLTLSQGAVLATLVADGPQRMSALADREGVRLPSMTDVVSRLERLGLVRREPDPADGRAVLVDLTEDGHRFYAELADAREVFLRSRLNTLNETDRTAIEAALPALWHLIENPTEPLPDVRSRDSRKGADDDD